MDFPYETLSELRFRADAKCRMNILPLGSIYWEDEMPNSQTLFNMLKVSKAERDNFWRVFAIRLKIWDGNLLEADELALWEEVSSKAPHWPLFRRLALSDEQRAARQQVEKEVHAERTEFFDGAEKVEFTDRSDGFLRFSANFKVDKKSEAEVDVKPESSYYRRLISLLKSLRK
jgi:hypothetical protein